MLPLIHRRLNAPHHHRTDTDRHDASELRTVNRHDPARVLPIHVQGTANRLRLSTIPSVNADDQQT